MSPPDPLAPLLGPLTRRLPDDDGPTLVITVAGPVAVGKSTLADRIARELRSEAASVAVVATDGFLWPNAVLEEKGLVARKGFPETFDLDRLDEVLAAARRGEDHLAVPVYSHERYDVEREPRRLARPDVLVVEGVIALQRRFGDVGIYLHADAEHVEAWYVQRFQELVAAAAEDPDSFYRAWVDLGPDEVADLARAVWTGVNLPNLVGHIAPSRSRADVVVTKGPDHAIREVTWVDP